MEKNKDEILPLGTVVYLKGLKRKMVIMGYMMKEDTDTRFYDYIGCVYPIGAVSNEAVLMFDRNLIDKIVFEGFTDKTGEDFRKDIKSILDGDKK